LNAIASVRSRGRDEIDAIALEVLRKRLAPSPKKAR